MRNTLITSVLCAVLGFVALPARASLQEMGDEAMAEITGQALFVADKIPGNLTGADGLSTPFTYYRIGIDGEMFLNLNIDKLQLGCGGFNEGIAANACDLDADFMSMSGIAGGPSSDFKTTRPYMELAIKNDGDKTRREIVGIKIGAQLAEGLMSIGRVYTTGQVNQEWGGTCDSGFADNVDNGSRLACHSGANRISGFMQAEMSGRGFVNSTVDTWSCFGKLTNNPGSVCASKPQEFVAVAGTRMQEIAARNMTLWLDPPITVLFVTLSQGYADIRENLRMLHKIVMGPSNKDFYISFQRERLRWPIYNYNVPYDTDGYLPVGNSKNGDTTSRAYHYPANTGFWMNIQNAEVLNADAGTINLSFNELLATLGDGAPLYNFNTGQIPADNCFGSLKWC